MNLCVYPAGSALEAMDYREMPVPNQFETTIVGYEEGNTQLQTTAVSHGYG